MFVRVGQSVSPQKILFISVRTAGRGAWFFLARASFPTHALEKSCQGLKIERFFETISQAIIIPREDRNFDDKLWKDKNYCERDMWKRSMQNCGEWYGEKVSFEDMQMKIEIERKYKLDTRFSVIQRSVKKLEYYEPFCSMLIAKRVK